jgi:DNA-binding HxlR family transcriptional regulator
MALGNTYESENCSAARALEVVGERWSLLIIRDALFRGTTRFSDFQRTLGLARNVLAARLEGFVEAGLMTRRQPENSAYHEYLLTQKGLDLKPAVIALTRWGDRWAAPNGPPIIYGHDYCGGEIELQLVCSECGEEPAVDQIGVTPGPGFAVAD